MAYSSYTGGPITIDHESIIKTYSASPSMLGRGHTLMDPQGPVWVRVYDGSMSTSIVLMYFTQSISASEYHPHLAAGSADGTCATTNTLRTTRRGGSVVCLTECYTPSTLISYGDSPSLFIKSIRWTIAEIRESFVCWNTSFPRYIYYQCSCRG